MRQNAATMYIHTATVFEWLVGIVCSAKLWPPFLFYKTKNIHTLNSRCQISNLKKSLLENDPWLYQGHETVSQKSK
jgi:hypothetical protein